MKGNLFIITLSRTKVWVVCFSILFFMLLGACSLGHQENNEKISTSLAFLKYYRSEVLKEKSIVLLDRPAAYNLAHCLANVTREKEYKLFDQGDFSAKFQSNLWDRKSIDGIELVAHKDLPNIRSPQDWSDFRKKIGKGYYTFSHPIVSKNLKYILFFTAYNCDERCGYSTLGLYERTKSGWKLIKKYCDEIS